MMTYFMVIFQNVLSEENFTWKYCNICYMSYIFRVKFSSEGNITVLEYNLSIYILIIHPVLCLNLCIRAMSLKVGLIQLFNNVASDKKVTKRENSVM